MTGWQRARTIIENDSVATKRDVVTKDFPRFEELWRGISWLVARKGDTIGTHRVVNNIEYRLHVFEPVSDDFPEVTLLYTVSQNNVIIHDIGIEIGKETAQPKSVAKIH
jgi:hypothetical protein